MFLQHIIVIKTLYIIWNFSVYKLNGDTNNQNNPTWHRNNLLIDLFLYEMIKYQLNITLYEKNKFVFHTLRYFVESGLLAAYDVITFKTELSILFILICILW